MVETIEPYPQILIFIIYSFSFYYFYYNIIIQFLK